MTEQIQNPENNWRQTVSDFRAYLRQTIDSLPLKQQPDTVDEPVSPKARKARSRKQVQAMSRMRYQSKFVYLLPVGQKRPVHEPSELRRFSSPLWIGIGDEDLKQKRKAT